MIVKLKRFLATACFCVVALASMSSLSNLQRDESWRLQADEASYPYQVLWLGSSHVFRTIVPQFLYNEYGVESLSATTPRQTCAYTLSILQDLPNLDQYKLVVLDIYSFLRPYTYDVEFNYTLSTTHPDSVPESWQTNIDVLSAASIRRLAEANPKKYLRILGEKELSVPLQYYFAFFYSHSQYLRMNRGNYEQLNGWFTRNKNYDLGITKTSLDNPFEQEIPTASDIRMNEQCKAYLMDIIKLCKSKGVPLLLTSLPYSANAEALIVMDEIAQLAAEHGVDYLSMETICNEAWLDWAEDFMDAGHTNHKGAVKVSDFFGAYLSDTYGLEDRRINPRANSPFLKNVYGYESNEIVMNFQNHPYILRDYLEALYDLDNTYLLLFTTGTAGGLDLHEDVQELLRNLNIAIPEEIPQEGFALMHVGTTNTIIAQSTNPKDALYASVDQASFRLSAYEGNIRVNHESVSGSWRDSQLVIYDLCSHSAIESISLNGDPDAQVQRFIR